MNHQSSPFGKASTAAGSAVHDINNKIGVILSYCELLENHCQLGTRATIDLETIREAAEALAMMVARLSDLNKEQL